MTDPKELRCEACKEITRPQFLTKDGQGATWDEKGSRLREKLADCSIFLTLIKIDPSEVKGLYDAFADLKAALEITSVSLRKMITKGCGTRDELRSKREGLRDSKDLGQQLKEVQHRVAQLEDQAVEHENIRLDLAAANRLNAKLEH
ncbi:hypothetical protein VE02_04718 [Pseudogymnoascus sp. 03VT05]|nr:hypothetical protein VE02_04718 [Pseudogymnoascus sp. 03VT05]